MEGLRQRTYSRGPSQATRLLSFVVRGKLVYSKGIASVNTKAGNSQSVVRRDFLEQSSEYRRTRLLSVAYIYKIYIKRLRILAVPNVE